MEIWPAIDILHGKCVRLKQGNYSQETIYNENPAEVARQWVAQGAQFLHVVDLDGAKMREPVNQKSVEEIVRVAKIPVEIGGGIRDAETIRAYLEAGIHRVVIGTLALKQPDWFREMAEKFPQKIVLGIDAKNGLVATEGWLETSTTKATALADCFSQLPLAALVYTDIAKDGMLEGPNFEEMAVMREHVPFPVVASGGVSSVSDIERLCQLGLPACIIGKALYEGRLTLSKALHAASTTIQ